MSQVPELISAVNDCPESKYHDKAECNAVDDLFVQSFADSNFRKNPVWVDREVVCHVIRDLLGVKTLVAHELRRLSSHACSMMAAATLSTN